MTYTFDLGKEGETLAREGHYETAEQILRLAYPTPENQYNLANVLRRQCKYDEALEVGMRSWAIKETDLTANLIGCLHLDRNDAHKAREWLEPIKHKYHFYAFCYALACLHDGQWEQGFHYYEARLHEHAQPLPMWHGEPLGNQVLAISCEQGYGDSIMFKRFLPLIEGKTVLLTQNVLTKLLGGQSGNRGFDAYWMCPLMSLPQRLGIKELPPFKPYICPLERFELPRLADTRLRVGLVWRSKSGSQLRKRFEIEHGQQKSIPLVELLPLAQVRGVKLYSLQHDGDSDIGDLGAGPLIENLAPRMNDFYDLACFVQEMDVIVSVDTGPAHLAGAMGKPAIVMQSYAGSWQWGPDGKSPWYPTVDVLRQRHPRIWTDVVENVARRLA